MSNDNPITRLLFAILSQKCLKDIDWNKVAHDPILRSEVTNGHAARMRYSRFKKQMEGGNSTPSTPRRPRDPTSVPRKSQARVQKNTSTTTKIKTKIKDRKPSDPDLPLTPGESSASGSATGLARVKSEHRNGDETARDTSDDTADEDSLFSRSMTAPTPERNMLHPTTGGGASFRSNTSSNMSFVKSEFESGSGTGSAPQTPGPASHSQCGGHDHTPQGSFGPGMMAGGAGDVMMGSFGSGVGGGAGGGMGLFGEVGMGQHQRPHRPPSHAHSHSNSHPQPYPHPQPHPSSFHGLPTQSSHPHHHPHLQHLHHHSSSFGPMSSGPMSSNPISSMPALSPMTMAPMHLSMTSAMGVHIPNDFDNLWAQSQVQSHQSQPQSHQPHQPHQPVRSTLGPQDQGSGVGVGTADASGNGSGNGSGNALGEECVKQEPRWEEEYESI